MWLLALLACHPSAPADTDTDTQTSSDTGAPVGCVDPAESDPAPVALPIRGTHEEDPSLAVRDGVLWMAFLSDADGDDEIYVTSSVDCGDTWSAPAQVTDDPDPDWFPSLVVTADGVLHVSWFRQSTEPPYPRQVWASSSADGLAWTSPVAVTDGTADDWAPALATDGDTLGVWFSSASRGGGSAELYVSTSADGSTWTSPALVADVNAADEHDVFPFVGRRDGAWVMAWERFSTSSTDYFDASSDVFTATSADGVTWTDVSAITDDDVVEALPAYEVTDGDVTGLYWTSTDDDGNAVTVEYVDPNGGGPFVWSEMDGWSVHLARVTDDDESDSYALAVWVKATADGNRLYAERIWDGQPFR